MKIPAVMERINRFFGYQAVAQIQAAQGPLPAPPAALAPMTPLSDAEQAMVAGQVEGVTSEPLRAALLKLGKALQQRARSSVVGTRKYPHDSLD